MGSIVVVVALYAFSDRNAYRQDSIVRQLSPDPVRDTVAFDLGFNSYYIAGATREKIYLGNFTAPFHMVVVNTLRADTQHVRLSVGNAQQYWFKNIRVHVDSPYFYITDGQMPGLFRGRIDSDWKADKFMFDSAYFMNCVSMTPRSFALFTTSSATQENILAKESADPKHLTMAPAALEKQVDGTFCTDGMLHYSKELQRLVYVYYYRNQYISLDTNLQVLYRARTIDTTSQAKIKVARISSEDFRTMAAPALTVNKKSCAAGSRLFIQSGIMGSYEAEGMFERALVIDVYDLNNAAYVSSFYLPEYNSKKLRDFKVFDDRLIALHDHDLVIYALGKETKMNKRYFTDR
jgi:hypothetical protein